MLGFSDPKADSWLGGLAFPEGPWVGVGRLITGGAICWKADCPRV